MGSYYWSKNREDADYQVSESSSADPSKEVTLILKDTTVAGTGAGKLSVADLLNMLQSFMNHIQNTKRWPPA